MFVLSRTIWGIKLKNNIVIIILFLKLETCFIERLELVCNFVKNFNPKPWDYNTSSEVGLNSPPLQFIF